MDLAIVDDNPDFRDLIRRVAEPEGWTVGDFPNGREFLTSLNLNYRPDLLFLDILMPKRDGIEVMQSLQTLALNCPVYVLTGGAEIYGRVAQEIGLATDVDIRDVITKPVPVQRIREILAGVRAERPDG